MVMYLTGFSSSIMVHCLMTGELALPGMQDVVKSTKRMHMVIDANLVFMVKPLLLSKL